MDDKIIVTNSNALIKKYEDKGLARICKALTELSASDKERGIKTSVIYLDDKSSMKKVRRKAVTNATDPRENKEAIDAVFKSFNPHYLMILGAPDVVPHQDLNNPAYIAGKDDDREVWSDLPYACDTPYSRDPSLFVGPTRVVGRLPDLFSATEPSYIISLLKKVVNYKRASLDDYKSYIGLSAKVWQGSTRISVKNLFGSDDNLLLAPPSGPNFPKNKLRPPMHFINCHGGPASPEFYGQSGDSYPVSLTTKSISGKIPEGTVAAVECCYGAELYDSITLAIDRPICQSYLEQGSHGYFGSTTIAYGPADSNGAADFICQYYLQNVLNGASVGRAALMARQQFVGNTAQMDAFDLKTLAQFCLLGDPSVQPIAQPSGKVVPTGVNEADAERFSRIERRQKMKMTGDFLAKTKPTASKRIPIHKLSSKSRTALNNITKRAGLRKKQQFIAFAVQVPSTVKDRMAKITTVPSRYLVTITIPKGKKTEKIKRGIAVVAKELNGRIVGYRIYHQR
jgi:hypothetical protein